MFIRKLLIAATATTLATSALAAAPANGNSALVHVGDLDLTQSHDQSRLNNRVERAARQICYSGMRGIAAQRAEQSCVKLALESAKPQTERAISAAFNGKQTVKLAMMVK